MEWGQCNLSTVAFFFILLAKAKSCTKIFLEGFASCRQFFLGRDAGIWKLPASLFWLGVVICPWWLLRVYVGDEKLPSYVGIMDNPL